ncbi:MAG: HAMP domain-containing sensor histidine kinase [Patescibacteria group bacterium]
MNLVALTKITERLTQLAEEHHDLLLRNAELNHLLREAEMTRAEEIARFAHEMKKPLAVIRGLIARCDPKTPRQQIRKTGQEIDAEVSRAAKILDDMIALARLETSARENKKLDLSEICTLVFEQQRAQFPKHKFEKKIKPGITIFSTPERVFAIVENLLENAGRHTPAGSEVFCELTKKSDATMLRVRDNGCGLTADEQEKILTPFTALGHSGGSGLGLAVVARAVEKLGGKLKIHSTKNRGSEFTVYLPA